MDKEEQFASRKSSRSQVFYNQGKIKSICGGLERSKMATQAVEPPTQAVAYTKSVAEWHHSVAAGLDSEVVELSINLAECYIYYFVYIVNQSL